MYILKDEFDPTELRRLECDEAKASGAALRVTDHYGLDKAWEHSKVVLDFTVGCADGEMRLGSDMGHDAHVSGLKPRTKSLCVTS